MQLNHVFPTVCVICRRNCCYAELSVCADCLNELQTILTSPCRICKKSPSGCKCPGNRDVRFGFFYNTYGVRRLIYAAKRRLENDMADLLIELAVGISGINVKSFDGVAYVPRIPKNKRQYGQDQAERLAYSFQRLYGIPVLHALERVGGKEQKLLSRSERSKNIKNKYSVRKDFPQEMSYKKILLVDDVCTTGATLEVCARLLRGNVSRAVVPFALAKTVLPNKK